MAFTIGSLSLVTALVSMPLTGAWHADVSVSPIQGETGAALTGQVTIELDGLTLVGTIVRSAPSDSLISARIVAGAGGLGRELRESYYKGSPTVRKVVEDILRESGETLAGASSAAILDTVIGTWQRERGSAGMALSRIVEAYGGSWRCLPNGAVLIVGTESWPAVEPEHTRVPGSDPAEGHYRIAWPEHTPADVLPGITFAGQRVSYVVHELAPGGLRTELRFVQPRTLLERMRELLVRDEWHGRRYPAIVETQSTSGLVDVVVQNSFGLTQVPIRTGVPGLRADVSQGQSVLVGFEGSDPQKPYVSDFAPSGSAKFGTLAFSFAVVSGATVLTGPPTGTGPLFFEATPAGDAAAAALSGTHILVPVTTSMVKAV